jgi:cobalt/nickel transport system permease protein
MHVPDGFFDGPTSAVAALASAATLTACARRARSELADREAPLAGLAAAFVFSVQMLNFPVAAGTSGHLLGGALAAVLLGPWTATLCVSVVLGVQALLFADGGLSALGLNVVLMAIVPVWVGYGAFRVARRLLGATGRATTLAAGIAAALSVPVAAAAFAGLFAIGGAADVPFGGLLGSMVGVHLLIGLGEGVITGATVGAVLATRPDLVRGHRAYRPATVFAA